MESASELVYVVDDDERVREALSTLLRANGRDVRAFSSGREFLDTPRRIAFACLILDLKMPGMSGLEVQKIVSRDSRIPVIFITGRADVPSAVLAMKDGAVDFLTKPVDENVLTRAVDTALARAHVLHREVEDAAALRALYQTLTPREQELLPLLASGLLNKQVAANSWHYRVHRAGTSRPHHEKNAGGFICHAGQTGKQAGSRNIAGSYVRCLSLKPIRCRT